MTYQAKRPLGCALAMGVMQSDLYPQLDDAERADCDELVRQNVEWFRAVAALPPQAKAEPAGVSVLNGADVLSRMGLPRTATLDAGDFMRLLGARGMGVIESPLTDGRAILSAAPSTGVREAESGGGAPSGEPSSNGGA